MKPEEVRLLLVDDSAMMRKVLRRLMSALGIGVIDEAPDGGVGLELFSRTPYDLVLTDWHMPVLTGLELLREIRQGGLRSDTPVIIFTGDVSPRNMLDALEAGATDFVSKPFVGGIVCEKVLRILALLPREHPTRV